MNYEEAIKTLNTFRNAYYNYTEDEEKKNVAQALDVVLPHNKKVEKELEELKRYPTADEVCEALGEYYNKPCIYRDGYFLIKGLDCAENLYQKVYIDHLKRKPNLITLIGRFYENEVKVE